MLEKKCERSKSDSRRKFTLVYQLNGKRCCKKFFTHTFDITDRVVMNCKFKARNNLDVGTDFRGTKKGKNMKPGSTRTSP